MTMKQPVRWNDERLYALPMHLLLSVARGLKTLDEAEAEAAKRKRATK